jgi:hypothetical protein
MRLGIIKETRPDMVATYQARFDHLWLQARVPSSGAALYSRGFSCYEKDQGIS